MIEKLKSDLADKTADIEMLNRKLTALRQQEQEIIKAGMRLEGVVAYLRQTIDQAEKASKE